MSKSSDADFDLELHFLPAWAQKGPEENRYADFKGEPEREGFDRRGRGPRDRNREGGRNRPPRRPEGAEARGPRPPQGQGGQPRFQGQGGRPPRRDGRGGRRDRQGPSAPPPAPLPEVNCTIVSDEKSVDLLARQIKMTGRAYPLFEIAQMILAKPERHTITLSVKKDAEGKVTQPIFVCAVDETPWLSEDEAVQHLLNRHFNLFYQAERTATEPPKGVYTFVAQCGMSGIVLGPPNYHDYQNRLHKLHAERFSKMPFESYKARVKIVKDEAIVKKWIDDQSWKTEYVCLNLPEPLKLPNREEVEKHFRQVHLPNVVKQVETLHMSGATARNLPCFALRRLTRQVWEDQRRFPLQVAVVLSQQFAARGLQFFKVNKTVTHVSVARPHWLDMDTVPVSEGVRQIVNYVNAHPRCSRRDLIESLAPTPVAPIAVVPEAAPAPVAPPAPAVEGAAPVEGTPGEAPAQAAPAEAGPQATAPAEPQPTPEQTAVIADLHWLVHQGHVIEFANGTLETAKKPLPKPPKPAPAQPAAEAPAADAAATAAPAVEGTPATPVEGEASAPADTAAAAPSAESLATEATATPEPPQAKPTAEAAPESTPSQENVPPVEENKPTEPTA